MMGGGGARPIVAPVQLYIYLEYVYTKLQRF